MGGHFDLDNKNLKISELEQKLQEEGIWSDPTKANQINNELTNLKKLVNKFPSKCAKMLLNPKVKVKVLGR